MKSIQHQTRAAFAEIQNMKKKNLQKNEVRRNLLSLSTKNKNITIFTNCFYLDK